VAREWGQRNSAAQNNALALSVFTLVVIERKATLSDFQRESFRDLGDLLFQKLLTEVRKGREELQWGL
jgi:hypothetical protein